ncbi:MAG: hypothetical protein ABS949_19965 [Solibacillus sp.]
MSNLLNNNNKKKLLSRGAAIVPDQQFNIQDVKEDEKPKKVEHTEDVVAKKSGAKSDAPKKKSEATNTSVRVTKQTRSKLNAIIQYGKAENVDSLIDILIDEYIENHFTKEDKKTYELVLKLIQAREK